MSYQQPGYPGTTPPSPYGAPKKDNTLLWVLGGIGALVLLCCCGVLGFFGWGALVAKESYESITSSYSEDSAGSSVSEGGTTSIDGGTVLAGWSISSGSTGLEPTGIRVRNDDSYAKGFTFYVNYLKDGVEVDDSFCSTSVIQPGASGSTNCLATIDTDIDYDSVTISEF